MSEPLSTSEIEDVLSSIRRLVSDDLRPLSPNAAPAPSLGRPQAAGAAPFGAAERAEPGKLLLTPALRVVHSDPQPVAEARGIDDLMARVRASVDQGAADWEPETGDLSMAPPLAEAAIWEDAPVIEDYAAPLEFVSSRGRAEADTQAEDETQTEAEIQTWAEPEAALTEAAALPAQEMAADLQDAPVDSVEENAPEARALPGWAQSAGADDTYETLPEPVATGTVEPDATWADAAEAAVLEELLGGASFAVSQEPAAPGSSFLPHGADEFVLEPSGKDEVPVDEAMLREIVRDVLREELQGRLGERITRNIRKLVRAEIARVMASDELL